VDWLIKQITETHTSQFYRGRTTTTESTSDSIGCATQMMYTLGMHVRTQATVDRMRGCTSNLLFTCVTWRSSDGRKCNRPRRKTTPQELRMQRDAHITHETQRSAACSGPQRAYVCLPSTLVKGGGIAMSFSTLSCSAHTTRHNVRLWTAMLPCQDRGTHRTVWTCCCVVST
jgi:hypothetical protein